MDEKTLIATPGAVRWIAARLDAAASDMQSRDLVPALCFFYSYQAGDETGRTIESCSESHFSLGWFRRDVAVSHGFVKVNVGSVSLFALPDTVARLYGKELRMETVAVGFPKPADRMREVLIAADAGLARDK